MGCTLLGVILAIAVIVGGFIGFRNFNFDPTCILVPFACFFILGGFVLGLSDISGYNEGTLVSTIQLVTLSNDELMIPLYNRYILIDGESHTYATETKNIYGLPSSKAPKKTTITGDNVRIIELNDYTNAKLKIYEATPKKTFLTFATLAYNKTEYVFFVPTGSVIKTTS